MPHDAAGMTSFVSRYFPKVIISTFTSNFTNNVYLRWKINKKRYKLGNFKDIIEDIDHIKAGTTNKYKKFLEKVSGLSKEVIELLIQNSKSDHWPVALRQKESRIANKEAITKYICKNLF